MPENELEYYMRKDLVEAGCDEAGRGCLAGPVFAAAVIIPHGVIIEGLNDSKQLNEKMRRKLRTEIESTCIWSVSMLGPEEIDRINILNASILAMQMALGNLKHTPEHILVDGNRFKSYRDIPYTTVIKGDGKFCSIAAASILAKTHRDEYMEQLSQELPQYFWSKNKGYPTSEHREAIRKHGACIHHRKSFTLLPAQLSLL
jgi:ribonuclease HII